MEHVAGYSSSVSTRMSPGALTLAVLLHGAAALALWWMAVNRPALPLVEEAIEITVEKPKPPDPPPRPTPEPKAQPQPQPKPRPVPQPAPPLRGVPPPAEITSDKRGQVAPSADQPKDIAGPSPRSLDEPVPKPQPPTQATAAEPPRLKPLEQPVPSPPPTQSAAAEPPKPKEPPPPLEQAVPQPPAPAPAVTSLPPPLKEPSPSQQPVVSKPPAPAVATVEPPTPPKSQAPPAVMPHPQPRPTPQVARPQVRPPAIAHRDTPPSSSPFVNPADVRNRALASENYIWQNARKFSFSIDELGRGYFLKLRVVIARDGRVVSADVAQSNGTPAMDRAILAAVRRNSPYLPLPPEIAGSQATFDVALSNY